MIYKICLKLKGYVKSKIKKLTLAYLKTKVRQDKLLVLGCLLKKLNELAATYVSTRGPCSIIGDEVLDYQVRNGAGYFHFSLTTSKFEC